MGGRSEEPRRCGKLSGNIRHCRQTPAGCTKGSGVTLESTDRVGSGQLMPAAGVSRRDAVINEIKRGIVLGSIRPGDKLTETSLSSALGVSRPTVREALNQVAREGLLIQEPYRGLRVADLDAGAVLDMADVRVALDMQAAENILADSSGRRMGALLAAWAATRETSASVSKRVSNWSPTLTICSTNTPVTESNSRCT